MFADDLRNRRVHVVVPAHGGLGKGNFATSVQAQEVAMTQDVLEDLVVPTQPAALQPRLGPRAVKLGAIEELRVLGGPQQRCRVHVGA